MASDLAAMSALSDDKLWALAHSFMPNKLEPRLRTLSEMQNERSLTSDETQQLDELREEYGRVTLRKAHAFALLRERGLYSFSTS